MLIKITDRIADKTKKDFKASSQAENQFCFKTLRAKCNRGFEQRVV
jgi:hypothetical protein